MKSTIDLILTGFSETKVGKFCPEKCTRVVVEWKHRMLVINSVLRTWRWLAEGQYPSLCNIIISGISHRSPRGSPTIQACSRTRPQTLNCYVIVYLKTTKDRNTTERDSRVHCCALMELRARLDLHYGNEFNRSFSISCFVSPQTFSHGERSGLPRNNVE